MSILLVNLFHDSRCESGSISLLLYFWAVLTDYIHAFKCMFKCSTFLVLSNIAELEEINDDEVILNEVAKQSQINF